MSTAIVEYTIQPSAAVHRIVAEMRVDGAVWCARTESFVDGEWIRSSDTQRGVAAFHAQTLAEFALLSIRLGVSTVRVTL